MADVSAIFGILLFLGLTFPGLLAAWWALFPRVVTRAHARIAHSPWRCFWLGLGLSIMLSIPIVLLFALPFGPAKMMGAGLLVLVLGIASLGAAGIAAFMAAVMAERSGSKPNGIGNFLRAAVALELGAAFPFIGWFLVIPVGVITSLGAAALSLLRWKSAKGVSAIPATEMQGLSNDAVAS